MSLLIRIYFNAAFGGLGGLIGWMLFGALGQKNPPDGLPTYLNYLLMGSLIGGAIAYFVVSVEAIRDSSLARFARLSTYGVVLGAMGGAVGGFLGNFMKELVDQLILQQNMPELVGTILTILVFAVGWSLLGMAVGMSEGIAARSLGKFSYGTIGGGMGGFIGGMIYASFLQSTRQETGAGAYLWSASGLVIMGACIGSLTALVRGVFLPASVKVLRGWQEGREYGLDKPANTLGRKEHVDIPLFRDMKVEKEHAIIRRLGKRYMLFNNNSPPENTQVNGKPVPAAVELADGDRIQLGNVVLKFQGRAAVNRERPSRRPAAATPGQGKGALADMLGK
jgi:hypothetical protein